VRSVVVADIGATKVRLGLWCSAQAQAPALCHVERLITSQFSSFIELLESYLKSENVLEWDALAIGVAGPVRGKQVSMTNLNWILDQEELSQKLLGKPVFLVNDLAAHAYSLSEIQEKDLFCLQKGKKRLGNQAVIAVGTGLGEALVYRDSMQFIVSASEGGHCTFSPFDEVELSLHRFLSSRYPDHVSWERALSGKFGFQNLYEYFASTETEGVQNPAPPNNQDWGPWIAEQARAGNPLAQKTLRFFFKLYGREAGNLALKALALGGVYLAGGVARKLISELSQSEFITAFSQKGRMSPLLKEVPISIILDPEAPLKGLGLYANRKLKETHS